MPAFIAHDTRTLVCTRICSLTACFAFGVAVMHHTPLIATESAMQMIEDAGQAGMKGDYKKAYDLYSQALKRRPNDAAIYALRGKILVVTNEPDRAIKDFSHAIRLDSENLANYYNRALVYAGVNRYDEAIGDLTIILSSTPEDHESRTHRARCWLKLNKYDAALQDTEVVLDKHPDYGPALSLNAETHFELKNYKFAQEQLTHYLNVIPERDKKNRSITHFLLAMCHERLNEPELALAEYLKSAELDPQSNGLGNAAATLKTLGRYDEAIELFSRLIKANPKNTKAYIGRGSCYSAKGESENALKDINISLQLEPDSAEAWANRAHHFRLVKNKEEAMTASIKSIQLNPKSSQAYRTLALIILEMPEEGDGGPAKALDHALKACEYSDWEDSSALDTLAAAYVANGDYVNAHKWLQESMKHNPPAIQTSPGALQHQKEIAEKAAAASTHK